MTKETKQTALEQFAIALYEKGLLIGNEDWIQDVLQEFKEIEKEQIMDAYDYGRCDENENILCPEFKMETDYEDGEGYYNNKFDKLIIYKKESTDMNNGQHYFDMMPPSIQTKFRVNLMKELHFFYGYVNSIKRFESYMQLKFENFEKFIKGSIRFSHSIEGESFWIGVSQTDFNTKEVTNEQQ